MAFLFEQSDDDQQTLRFAEIISGEVWANHGGDLKRVISESTTLLQLDFSNTMWADPLPLLGIICEIRQNVRNVSREIVFDLGVRKGYKKDQFPIFLQSQGFLQQIYEFATIRFEGRTYSTQEVPSLTSKIMQLRGGLTFSNPDCIKAKVIDVSKYQENDIIDLVEACVAEAYQTGVKTWLGKSGRARGLILQKLRVCLQETVENACEHAYPNGEGFVGVYGRIRLGSPDSPEHRFMWQKETREERIRCPTLNRSQVGRAPGWIELFVSDQGSGLTLSHTEKKKSPMLLLSRRMFLKPFSRLQDRGSKNKTDTTGLQHIGKILSNNTTRDRARLGDFVRVYCNGEWVSEHFPWPTGQLQPGYKNYRNSAGSYPLGTSYHFTFQPLVYTLEEQRDFYPQCFEVPNHSSLENVRRALSNKLGLESKNPPYSKYDFFDFFIKGTDEIASRGEGFSKAIKNIQSKTVVFRPDRATRKADLRLQLFETARVNGEVVENIIYADVPAALAVDFSLVLSSEKWARFPRKKNLNIFIVSQDWSVCCFSYSGTKKTLATNKRKCTDFIHSERGLSIVAKILKDRDSMVFWERVLSPEVSAFVSEKIVWMSLPEGDEDVVDGYLDVATALSDRTCLNVARSALRRAISAFPAREVVLSDKTILPVIESDFNVKMPDQNLQKSDINIVNTVVLTGSTAARFAKRNSLNSTVETHLLVHTNSIEGHDDISALDWLPNPVLIKSPKKKYHRIPNTPNIFRGGAKAIPLPRFSASSSSQELSIYGQSPQDAYRLWQKHGALRIGHWHYGDHHDLLTVDLLRSIREDIVSDNAIVIWLKQIIDHWKENAESNKQGFCIIYPRHKVTDLLVDQLISNGIDSTIFFPFQVSESLSLSPLVSTPTSRERLWKYFKSNFKTGGVAVIFDDAILSGFTSKLLKEHTTGLWAPFSKNNNNAILEVNTLAVMERSGYPIYTMLAEEQKHQHPRYWRWDVPTLGKPSNCVLCFALKRAEDLAGRLRFVGLDARVNQWKDTWSVRDLVNAGPYDGLKPTKLGSGEMTHFGYESDQKLHKVDHRISTSRAALACELTQSTTRSDYALKKAKFGQGTNGSILDSQTKIEILVSHCMLFWSKFSIEDKLTRLECLLDLIWFEVEVSPFSAAAAICFFIQEDVLFRIEPKIQELIETKGIPNEDALLLAVMIYSSNRELFPKNYTNRNWTFIKGILQPVDSILGTIGRLFSVIGWNPSSVHRSLLPELLNKKQLSTNELSKLVMMLKVLVRALSELDDLMLDPGQKLSPLDDANQIKMFITQISKSLPNFFEKTTDIAIGQDKFQQAAVITESDGKSLIPESLILEINTFLYSSQKSLRGKYLETLTLDVSEQDILSTIVRPVKFEMLKGWSEFSQHFNESSSSIDWENTKPIIRTFIPNDSERKKTKRTQYVYFDLLISNLIRDILSNVRHASKMEKCIWGPQHNAEAHMWVRGNFTEDQSFVYLEFVNCGNDSGGKKRLLVNQNLAHLRAIGGRIECELRDGLFYAKVYIPTVRTIMRVRSAGEI